MSETHTPGPWSVEECHLDFRKFNRGDYMILSENKIVPCLVWGGAGWSQGRANARLIAAAPDMLAALCIAQAAIDPENDPPQISSREALKIIVATIAKATEDQ